MAHQWKDQQQKEETHLKNESSFHSPKPGIMPSQHEQLKHEPCPSFHPHLHCMRGAAAERLLFSFLCGMTQINAASPLWALAALDVHLPSLHFRLQECFKPLRRSLHLRALTFLNLSTCERIPLFFWWSGMSWTMLLELLVQISMERLTYDIHLGIMRVFWMWESVQVEYWICTVYTW